jgi:uncharacterized membrane protein
MRGLLVALLVVVSLAYPFIVYLGLQRLSPAVFAGLLLFLAAIKYFAERGQRDLVQLAMVLVMVVFSLLLAVTNHELLLRLYPVVISLSLAGFFAVSLRQPESLLTRLARLSGKEITPNARSYTWRLTLIWAILLLFNACISLYLALFASLYLWTLYSGLVSYLIFGSIFLLELVYRRIYIARYGP